MLTFELLLTGGGKVVQDSTNVARVQILLLGILASGFSWETANRKPQISRAYGLAVTFAFEPQEGLPAVSDLRQGFLPQKIVQPRV